MALKVQLVRTVLLRWSRLFGQLFGFLSGNPVQFVVEAVGM